MTRIPNYAKATDTMKKTCPKCHKIWIATLYLHLNTWWYLDSNETSCTKCNEFGQEEWT